MKGKKIFSKNLKSSQKFCKHKFVLIHIFGAYNPPNIAECLKCYKRMVVTPEQWDTIPDKMKRRTIATPAMKKIKRQLTKIHPAFSMTETEIKKLSPLQRKKLLEEAIQNLDK